MFTGLGLNWLSTNKFSIWEVHMQSEIHDKSQVLCHAERSEASL